MFGAGSVQDHERLRDALARHDSAEALADFLKTREGVENANRAYDRLCAIALRCGFSFKLDEACVTWARRRVATFNRQYGRA